MSELVGGEDLGSNPASGCQDFHAALNEFREQSILTDVTIFGEDDEPIHAHSVVLAAGSDVLKSTFTLKQASRMIQKQGFTMRIDGISSQIWRLLLDFLYLRRLSVQLSASVLKELYVAARILGIKNLVSSLSSLITSMNLGIDINSNMDAVNIKLTRKDVSKYFDQGVQVNLEDGGFPPLYVNHEFGDDLSLAEKKEQLQLQQSVEESESENEGSRCGDSLNDEDFDGLDGPKRSLRTANGSAKKRAKLTKKDLFTCVNVVCGKTFDSAQALSDHHFHCIMSSSSYRLSQYATKDETGRLTYSDPFIPPDETDAIAEPFAIEIKEEAGKLGKGNRTMYQCGHCERVEPANRIVKHLAHVHGKRKPIRCKICEHKWYRDARTFLDHYTAEHTPTIFKCEHCPSTFEKRDKLARHVLYEHKHGGKLRYQCRGCGKMFKRSAHARRHETYHKPMEERRKHPCTFCGKRFCTVFDLRKHEQIHSDDKPFQCSLCNYRSIRRSNVVLHERKHGVITANYMCITCGRYYLAEHAFRAHLEETGHEGKHVCNLTQEEHEKVTHLAKHDSEQFDEAMEQSEPQEMTLSFNLPGSEQDLPIQAVSLLPESTPLQVVELVQPSEDQVQTALDAAQIEQLISQNIQAVLGADNESMVYVNNAVVGLP